jgi:hypothetical protein
VVLALRHEREEALPRLDHSFSWWRWTSISEGSSVTSTMILKEQDALLRARIGDIERRLGG